MFLNKVELNFMSKKIFFIALILLFSVMQAQAQYELKRKVISSGGKKIGNFNFEVKSTIGQSVIGQSSNVNYVGKYGFWHQPSYTPIPYVLEIPLSAGWNMISSNVIPENTSLAEVLQDIREDVLIIKNGAGQFWMPNPPPGVGNLTQWNFIDGYQLYMTEEAVLVIAGVRAQASTVIPINGWKLVSYLPEDPLPAQLALSSIENVLVIAKNGQGEIYFPMYGINTFEQNSLDNQGKMIPTKGYMIYTAGAGELIYAMSGSIMNKEANINFNKELKPSFLNVNSKNTGNNAVIIVESNSISDGTEIGLYNTKGELIGAGVISQGRAPIVVWGDNEMTKEIDGLTLDEPLLIKAFTNEGKEVPFVLSNVYEITTRFIGKSINYFPNAIYIARINSPEEEIRLSLAVKPNPVQDKAIIEYQIPDNSNVKLELYSITGELVYSVDEGLRATGAYKIMLSTENLSSGSYNLLLKAGNNWTSQIFIVNK